MKPDDYDRMVADSKSAVTTLLCRAVSDAAKENMSALDQTLHQLADQVDQLNAAWDKLTNCLVRQRSVRDAQIMRLMNELAETKK